MTLNISGYPQCARILKYQFVNMSEPGFNRYWAAVNVASGLPDTQLEAFGGFDFSKRTDENGAKLLSRLEKFLRNRSQRYAKNSFQASESLRAALGARGVRTSMLTSEDDYWCAAELLFPCRIERNGGFSSLYVQISAIPKRERKALANANLRRLPKGWVSSAANHQSKLSETAA